jgi:hypothetical protein
MKRKCKAIAVSTLAFGALVPTAAAAEAKVPPEPYPNYVPSVVEKVPVDDTTSGGIQATPASPCTTRA